MSPNTPTPQPLGMAGEEKWWQQTLLDIEEIVRDSSEVSPSDHYILDMNHLHKELKAYVKRRTAPKDKK